MKIHQLLEQGFTKTAVAKKLGISRPTLYRYLKKSPKEMADWIESTKKRAKKLDPYKELILSWLKEHPDMTASQVEDWLKERHSDLKVSESTVRSYVRNLRKEFNIPKTTGHTRDYEAVPDPEMGEQAQVDFGEKWLERPDGRKVKLYFIAFVLSHSRYKYTEFLDRPFTTLDVIRTHENAFHWFEGIPREIVYDQDSLILVSENGGDLILTKEFEMYRQERAFRLHVCRKADPESKGRIENVIGYIKNNFAAHRKFTNLDRWNEDAWKWLERTGNYKVHNTTKKRPVEVFQEEKEHLRPITEKLNQYAFPVSSITRRVRPDNTILYQSNRYSVPLGTYNKQKTVYISIKEEDLFIYASKDGDLIARHKVCKEKGKLIQDTQHTRDRSKGIEVFIETVASHFDDYELAKSFLAEIRKRYSRYIRDQLQMMMKQIKRTENPGIINAALRACEEKKLYCGTDFVDMVRYIERQRQVHDTNRNKVYHMPIKPLETQNRPLFYTIPQQRNVDEYIALLEGKK